MMYKQKVARLPGQEVIPCHHGGGFDYMGLSSRAEASQCTIVGKGSTVWWHVHACFFADCMLLVCCLRCSATACSPMRGSTEADVESPDRAWSATKIQCLSC